MSQARSSVWGAVSGGMLLIVGSVLPWFRSGRRWRNSFSTASVLGHVSSSIGGAWTALLRFWPIVWPLAVGVALAVVSGRPIPARLGSAILTSVMIVVGAVATSRSIPLGYGYWVCGGGTMLLVACSIRVNRSDVG